MISNTQAAKSIGLALSALLLFGATTLAQMQVGSQMKNYDSVFGVETGKRSYPYDVDYIGGSVPGNILFPGEQGKFRFRLKNNRPDPVHFEGKVDVISYGTRGVPGDIWLPDVYKIADLDPVPVQIDLPPHGTGEVEIAPPDSRSPGWLRPHLRPGNAGPAVRNVIRPHV